MMRKISFFTLILFIFTNAMAQHVGSPTGFATVSDYGVSTTTGGAGGEVVIINGQADAKKLQDALDDNDDPKIIYIYGTVTLPEYPAGEGPVSDVTSRMSMVRSNKTILGMGCDATIEGSGLSIYSGSGEGPDAQLNAVHNVIIQNITFTGALDDAINIQGGSHHIWIDHCTFTGGTDGLVDVKRASDLVTISYCIFTNHGKMSLVGHSDDPAIKAMDMGHLRVTYDHVYWKDNGTSTSSTRHPRIRHGIVHVLNCYFHGRGGGSNTDGVVCNEEGKVYVEGNYFQFVKWGSRVAYGDPVAGEVVEVNNLQDQCSSGFNFEGSGPSFNPSAYYSYTAAAPADVPAQVIANAGACKIAIPEPGTTYTLTTSTGGNGTVSPANGSFSEGAEVTLTATPAEGYQFDSWSGDGTGSQNPLTLVMNGNKTVQANFSAITYTQYTLTANTSGSGTVELSPAGGIYNEGTIVTATANAALGYAFSHWEGTLTGSQNSSSVTMDGNKTLTAVFVESAGANTLEMEDGYWDPALAIFEDKNAGFSGTGYVNTNNEANTWTEITVTVAEAQAYTFSLYYAASSDRPLMVSVNGTTQIESLETPSTGSFTTWMSTNFILNLTAGDNVVRFTALSADGAPNLDKIELATVVTGTNKPTTSTVPAWEIFGNPVKDILDIRCSSNSKEAFITVFDQTGKLVKEETGISDAGNLLLDVSGLSPGFYFCNIIQNNKKSIVKFIKE